MKRYKKHDIFCLMSDSQFFSKQILDAASLISEINKNDSIK